LGRGLIRSCLSCLRCPRRRDGGRFGDEEVIVNWIYSLLLMEVFKMALAEADNIMKSLKSSRQEQVKHVR
jgi:hypothetical protein